MICNNLTAAATATATIWDTTATATENGTYTITTDRACGTLRIILTSNAKCDRIAATAQVKENSAGWGDTPWLTLDMRFFEMHEITADDITEWADRSLQTAIDQINN